MSKAEVNPEIPHETLLKSLAALSLAEKRQIRKWLDEEIKRGRLRELPADYRPEEFSTGSHRTFARIWRDLRSLRPSERLAIVDLILNPVQEDIFEIELASRNRVENKRQLAAAAKILLSDYETDEELTAFTTLDDEPFYEPR